MILNPIEKAGFFACFFADIIICITYTGSVAKTQLVHNYL